MQSLREAMIGLTMEAVAIRTIWAKTLILPLLMATVQQWTASIQRNLKRDVATPNIT